ncbi:hypothetical protein LUZ61_018109 [Rhynchospora tenuis]|uniref:3'-5' exonuclease domain-containing protein n=1 Tax=Rhynchospora tenuis TaxID=198213 RepID=A0AAD5Z8K6_9POAL|nr:hypothetical protein LUZ61_018109 [Rhynchospora tenuis]
MQKAKSREATTNNKSNIYLSFLPLLSFLPRHRRHARFFMDQEQQQHRQSFPIHLITSSTCTGFTHFIHSLRHSTVVGLDAEWKPRQSSQPNSSPFPTVTLLQIACQYQSPSSDGNPTTEVFLVDLLTISVGDVYVPIRELFESEGVVKLGFRFKQDLVYLSHTFSSQGFEHGFDVMEPYLDIANIYHYLKNQDSGKRPPKYTKSLAAICEEILGISLSKEMQCSDWSCRPLSEDQIQYAAADAFYLIEIFSIFQERIVNRGNIASGPTMTELNSSSEELSGGIDSVPASDLSANTLRLNGSGKEKVETDIEWQGPAPWEQSIGGDGVPKFLCDIMIEGLARHLRSVGIDAALPSSKKPDPRELLNQAYKAKRLLLTRDVKLLRYQYLAENQVYIVKRSLKNDQLLEVIETFDLCISKDQLMSRCTKCNGTFTQKSLSVEEAVEASNGLNVVPPCLYGTDLQFWKCSDCHRLYWEGTKYQNAVEKFALICKLGD